jgi:hypothetical protein
MFLQRLGASSARFPIGSRRSCLGFLMGQRRRSAARAERAGTRQECSS